MPFRDIHQEISFEIGLISTLVRNNLRNVYLTFINLLAQVLAIKQYIYHYLTSHNFLDWLIFYQHLEFSNLHH
jgi:hypothetical protein